MLDIPCCHQTRMLSEVHGIADLVYGPQFDPDSLRWVVRGVCQAQHTPFLDAWLLEQV